MKIIFIIITVVLLISGGYFVWQYFESPEQNEDNIAGGNDIAEKISGWLGYQNERYQYEIKYPAYLDIGEDSFDQMNVPIETANSISWEFPSGDQTSFKTVVIEVKDNLQGKDILAFLGYDSTDCKIDKRESEFAKISCEAEEGALQTISAGFSNNNRVYIISLLIMLFDDPADKNFSSEINTYDLMLSTFKFLEGEVIVPAQKTVKDTMVMSNMSMMASAASIYYDDNNSYLNIATDKDIRNLQTEIQNSIGRWPGIISSDNAYCIDVLLSDGNTRYCVDSDGRRGENLGCSNTQLKCINY